MTLSRKDFDERLADRNLSDDDKAYLRREYYKDMVKPTLKNVPRESRRQTIQDWGIVAPPAKQSARTRDHLLPSLVENVMPMKLAENIGSGAVGAARYALDENPIRNTQRAIAKGVDTALDATVGKALGLPPSEAQLRKAGLPENHRMLPYVAPENRHPAEAGGAFAASLADPVNLVAPLNAFAKAAPAARAGINLLPKAAPPSAAVSALKAATGAGITNATINGATSALGQVADGRSLLEQTLFPLPVVGDVTLPKVAADALAGGAFGVGLGGIGAGLMARAANRARLSAEAAGQVRAAGGEAPGTIAGGTVTGQDIQGLNSARELAAGAHGAASDLNDEALVAAIMQRHRPRTSTPGILDEDLARSMAADYVAPTEALDAPGAAPVAGPRTQARPNGPTLSEREAAAAQTQAEQAQAEALARSTHPVADSPYLDSPAPRLYENPMLEVQREVPATPPGRPQPTPGIRPDEMTIDSPLIDAPAPRLRENPLLALVHDEAGTAQMPSPEDARALGNAAVDTGISAAEAAARVARPIDALIERAIGATRVGVPVRAAAGFVRRGKDAAKERLRTGVTGGASEAADDLGRSLVSSSAPVPYQDLKDTIRSQTIRQMQGLTDEAARLEQAGVNQEALHDIVTDASLSSPDAEAVRARTNQVSQDLLDVGALTPQQQAKWDNQYLPRSYAGKDNAIEGLARRARRAVTLAGSKRRGKVEEVSPHTLAVRQKPWEEAGAAADGRVLLRDRDTGETMLVSRKAVGNFTGEWSNLGAGKGGKVKAWRDWTPTEREAMGELKNVSQALRKLAGQAYGDLFNGRLLKAVSENPEWAVRDVPGQAPPEGWIYIDKKTVKSNGAQRWGALADHWVEPTIARDLAAATNNDGIGQVVKALRTYTGINQFKKLKVIYNPASHGNQLMQNMITLEAAGGSVTDMPRAARLLRSADDPTLAQFRELGLYGDDYLSTEGMAGAGSADHLDWGALTGVGRVPQWLDEAASKIYQFSDDMTRTAYVLGKLDEGVPVEQAVREARERFYNGNTVNSGFARLGSASLLPFVKPALYTIDKLPDLIEANPVKAVKLLAYWFAFDQGLKALSGHAGDEDGRQALLPDYQKGTAKTVPLPIRDTRGQELMFDYQRMNPAGSAFGVNDRTGFGPVPEAFVPTGGPLGAVGQAIANRDLFRDKPLRTETTNDTPGFLAQQFLPGFSANGQRLWRAMWGQPEADGETQYDVPTALANMVGVKAMPFNPQKGYDQNASAFLRERDEIRALGSRYGRQLENQQISQAEYDARVGELEDRINELAARFEAWDAQAQRGLEAFGGNR